MLKILIFFLYFTFIILNSYSEEKKTFLMLKNNKVNVRYGPSFEYPIKYIYKKIQLPVQLIDKKENFRRIIDHKKNTGWIHVSQLKKSKSLKNLVILLYRFCLKFSAEIICSLFTSNPTSMFFTISNWISFLLDFKRSPIM